VGQRILGVIHVGLINWLKKPVSSGSLSVHGRLSLTVLDEQENVVDYREGDNVMCTNGLTVIANALVWSGIQDQAASLGVTTPTYLTPLWGAVGSGVGTVAASDTLLFNELGRQTVGAGASTPATASISAQATWLFYFPSPTTTWTVTEAGVFANGSSIPATVASAGTLLDHWAFMPSVTVTSVNTLILQATFNIAGV
jgi:hypothetical protein